MILAPWQRYALAGVPAYTPAQDLGANGVWYSLTEAGLLVRNTQPTLLDAACDDVSKWLSGSSADLTNPTAAPRSGSCMRVTYGGSASPYAAQAAPLINGNRYAFDLYARNGSVSANLYFGAASVASTASATWANLTGDATATNTYLRAYALGAAGAGQYAEFDDVMLTNLSVTTALPKAATGALVGANLVQATAAAMGWDSTTLINGKKALEFDGTADHYTLDAAAVAMTLHKGGGLVFVCQPSATGAGTDTLFDNCTATAANVGFTVDYDTAAETLRVLIANGSGTFVVDETIAMSKGVAHEVEISIEAAGFSIAVDGGAATTGALVGALSAADASSVLSVGRTTGGTNFWAGLIADWWVGTAAGAAKTGAFFRAEFGL